MLYASLLSMVQGIILRIVQGSILRMTTCRSLLTLAQIAIGQRLQSGIIKKKLPFQAASFSLIEGRYYLL